MRFKNYREKEKVKKVRIFNTVDPLTTFYDDLIPHWISLGWQVEVVMSRAEYRPVQEKRQPWLTQGVKVRWTPGFGLTSGKLPTRSLGMLVYIFVAALKSLFAPPVDCNLFLTQPPLFFLWGIVLRRLRSQPYFIVLMDLYPDVAVQAGILRRGSLLARLLTRLSRFGLRRADGVNVIGRCMRQRVLEAGAAPERVWFIPNWVDPDAVCPIEHAANPFRRERGWQDKFVILYSGNIGVSHYFDDILEVSLRLRRQAHIVFAFIGQGARLKEIRAFKESHRLSNIELLPFQEYSRLSHSLGAADLHFVSLRSGFEGLVVPSKAYGSMAACRPIIYQGESSGEIARLIQEENIGTVVPLQCPDRLEAVILTYLEDPQLVREQGKRARHLAQERYCTRLAREQYRRFIEG